MNSGANCNLCLIFEAYQTHAESSLDQLVSAIHGPFAGLVIGIAGLWAIWIGIQVFIGTLDAATSVKQVFFLVLGFGCYLGLRGGLIGDMFTACVDIMGSLASAIMGGGGGLSGISALLYDVERSLGSVFDAATAIMQGGSSWTVHMITYPIYGIALIVPYILLLILFVSHASVALFRMTLVFGVSPFLVGLAAFPFGRGLIAAGVRMIIGSIMTMLCVTTVFSIVAASVMALGIGTEDNFNPDAYIDLTSGRFLLALVMGWLGAALVSEAVNIAGQVSSAVLGTVSAGIMSAGVMRGGSMGVSAARSATGYAGAAGRWSHEKTWEKPKPRPGHILETGGS